MIQLHNVSKRYQRSGEPVTALQDLSLHVASGEFVVVRGASGSGKTTLLLTVGGMMRPSDGRVCIDDRDIYALSPKDRALFRACNIGFVFQMFHLVPYLTAIENVLLACTGSKDHIHERARLLLEELGIAHRLHHLPSELSAGEKQRTAIARAMLNEPKLILADEPTGNLDPDNAKVVIEFLSSYQKKGGTVLFVTHGEAAQSYATKTVFLDHGKQTGSD